MGDAKQPKECGRRGFTLDLKCGSSEHLGHFCLSGETFHNAAMFVDALKHVGPQTSIT